MEELVSVIIPVYKVEKYLDRCVDSLINQTYKNLEIVLVDDGSPDNSGKLCDAWAERDNRVVVIHKQNAGVSMARNDGIDKAKGDFICFVDSDDFVEPDYVKTMLEKQKETDADIVFCKFYDIKNGSKYEHKDNNLKSLAENRNINYFYAGSNLVMGSLCRCLFNKKMLIDIKLNNDIKYCEDLLFLTEIILKKKPKMAMVDEYLYNYFENSNSATKFNNPNTVKNFENGLLACADLLQEYGYDNLAKCAKFNIYAHTAQSYCYVGGDKKELKQNKYNTKENYIAYKTTEKISFKQKVKAFVLRHKFYEILKILYKLNG